MRKGKKTSAEGLNPEVKMATGKKGRNQTNLKAFTADGETKKLNKENPTK